VRLPLEANQPGIIHAGAGYTDRSHFGTKQRLFCSAIRLAHFFLWSEVDE
jgi:hypothetical protein